MNLTTKNHPGDIDLSEKDQRDYSISRATLAYIEKDWSNAGLEREVNQTLAKQLGRTPQGFFVPMSTMSRAMVSTGATGMIGSDHKGGDFIEMLYSRSFLGRVNARLFKGLVADLDIPKQTGGIDFGWMNNETTDGSMSDPDTEPVNMTPKTICGAASASRKILLQSNPGVDRLLENDVISGIRVSLDQAAINGVGGDTPLGILKTPGLALSAAGENGGAPAWANIVELETLIATANADVENMSYVMTAGVRGLLKSTEKASSTAQFIMGDGNTLNGYNALVTESMPKDGTKGTHTTEDLHSILFGDFSQLMVAFWGGLDIKPNEITHINRGQLDIWAFLDADVAVRHIEAFSAMTDIIT